jgi:hypothetical protein
MHTGEDDRPIEIKLKVKNEEEAAAELKASLLLNAES